MGQEDSATALQSIAYYRTVVWGTDKQGTR